jgi:hypothetical protein
VGRARAGAGRGHRGAPVSDAYRVKSMLPLHYVCSYILLQNIGHCCTDAWFARARELGQVSMWQWFGERGGGAADRAA